MRCTTNRYLDPSNRLLRKDKEQTQKTPFLNNSLFLWTPKTTISQLSFNAPRKRIYISLLNSLLSKQPPWPRLRRLLNILILTQKDNKTHNSKQIDHIALQFPLINNWICIHNKWWACRISICHAPSILLFPVFWKLKISVDREGKNDSEMMSVLSFYLVAQLRSVL